VARDGADHAKFPIDVRTYKSGKAADLLRRLRRLATGRGWEISERQAAGSHLNVRLHGRTTVIAMHRGDIPTGTYRKILKDLGLAEADLEV
jgi:predicted RNA binding protein YcfA (HicA-like mRNA interferase family)